MSEALRRLVPRPRHGWHPRLIARIALIGVGALVLLGAIWIVVTGLLVRNQLTEVQDRLSAVRKLIADGDIKTARLVAADIPARAERAHDLTTGPAWWIGSHIPLFGTPLHVARGTTLATENLSVQALPPLMKVATDINPSRLRQGDTIRLDVLTGAGPELQSAARTVDRSVHDVETLPTSTWLGLVDDGRAKVVEQLVGIRQYVDAAARAVKVLPVLLGEHHTQRFFIGLQNESELRGTGGLPGAFAIVEASAGTIKFTHFESDSVLLPNNAGKQVPTGLDFGPDYRAMFAASDPTNNYQDSNVSPNFPYAAQIWARMWERVSGEHVDGALAVDPTTLSYLLEVTGPAATSNGRLITGNNVVSLTQRDAYALFRHNAQRKEFLVSTLRAATHKLISGGGSSVRLLRALGQAGSEHRLLAWSSDPAVEKLLLETDFGGAIPTTAAPFGAAIFNNAAAGKLDYYLNRSVVYESVGCGATRDVTVTIQALNQAPSTGLPKYVTTRLDHPPASAQPGDSRTILDYYATRGARLVSVRMDGKPATAAALSAFGHPVYRFDLELPRGQTRTVVLHLKEPASKSAVTMWNQPGVTPVDIHVGEQVCG